MVLAFAATACIQERSSPEPSPTYQESIAPILTAHCSSCHTGDTPAGNWRSDTYLGAIGCVGSSTVPATLPANGSAPILHALEAAPHQELLAPAERQALEAWVSAATPAFRGTVHDPGIVDPRSKAWHGQLLRDRLWAPMLDPSSDIACGRCHDGVPARPAGITTAAPGATPCTSCHSDPGGVLACPTCHGNGSRIYPPRDTCFFPEDASRPAAHAAHVEPSSTNKAGMPCSTCHPVPGTDVISGAHGNGSVEIVFDANRAGSDTSYDRATQTCTVSCHDRGGARARPQWADAMPMGCADCHGAPPAGHFPGECNQCHREANGDGSALLANDLHMNGRVDLGDGSGTCSACHGRADDPSPATGAHASHHAPRLASPIDCAVCHVTPADVIAPGHLDGVAQVVFTGRAAARGSTPSWDGQTCTGVACHGAGLSGGTLVTPSWSDTSGAAAACGSCHGAPPTSAHTTSASCDRVECHGSEVVRTTTTLGISDDGRSLHVNGAVDFTGL